jgi:hypothetical protein
MGISILKANADLMPNKIQYILQRELRPVF